MTYNFRKPESPKNPLSEIMGAELTIGGIVIPLVSFLDTDAGVLRFYVPHPETGQAYLRHEGGCPNADGWRHADPAGPGGWAQCLASCGVAEAEIRTDPSNITIRRPAQS